MVGIKFNHVEKKISQLHVTFFLRQIDRKKEMLSCLSVIRYILNDQSSITDQIDDLIRTIYDITHNNE